MERKASRTWAHLQSADELLRRGQSAPVMDILGADVSRRDQLLPDHAYRATLLYCCAATALGEPEKAIPLLNELRSNRGFGSSRYDNVKILTALAAAQFAERKFTEAAQLAVAASLLACAKGLPSAEAKFHSGCAFRLLGDQEHAEQSLLESIASACTEFDPLAQD